jgi:hypothetical protein
VLIKRAVRVILAALAAISAAFVEHAGQKHVTAQPDARTARRAFRQVGGEMLLLFVVI